MNFSDYQRLIFERHPNGVLLITINRPEKLNATDAVLSAELTRVWLDVARDDATRVAVITGAGTAFCAGGDIEMEVATVGDYKAKVHAMNEARDLVLNMINCDKPIVSAINGVAVGAGLAVALIADISIIGEDVRFTDGHLRLGIAAGDHATIIWPLLCGLAKAKYYLFTADFIEGREAERIGLVSKAVANADVVTEALAVADRLGTRSPLALQWTKRSLNHWVRAAQPIFESSLALEILNFFGDDAAEGFAAILEKREPNYPSLVSEA